MLNEYRMEPAVPVWISIQGVAADLGMPVEVVRIGAEIDLNRDMYDPESDSVTERGKQLLSEYLST